MEPRLKVRAALSCDREDCKKTHGLITLLISQVTNYKMPERLVLTNIPVLAIFNYQRYTPQNKFIYLIEFLEPTFYLKISIHFWEGFELLLHQTVIPEDRHKTGRVDQSTVLI